MPSNVNSDKSHPSSEYGKTYIGTTGNEAIDENTAIVETKRTETKDTIEEYEHWDEALKHFHQIVNATTPEEQSNAITHLLSSSFDNPSLSKVNVDKLKESQSTQILLKNNPWLTPSLLYAFYAIMAQILTQQKELHLTESLNELTVRSDLFDMAKQSGALAKALMDNQAQEQMTQAMCAFAQAGVSAMNFVQITRSVGAATEEVDNKIQKQGEEINRLEREAGFGGADGRGKITVGHDMNIVQDADTQQLKDERAKLIRMQTARETDIISATKHKDESIHALADVQKQTINGVQGVLVAQIKTDSGVKEQEQKILDGFIQTMNKHSDAITKQRDSAQESYRQMIDMLKSWFEKINQQFHISGRG